MRISDNRPVGEVRKTARGTRSGGTSAVFRLFDEEPAAETKDVARAGAYVPISDVSVLLAMQTVDDRSQRRQMELRQGHETLDALDELKLDLLAGRVSGAKLTRIASLANRQREEVGDSGLDRVLAQIELRAKVELAKLEKASS